MVHVPIDSAMCLVRGTGQRLLDRTWVDEDWPHDAYGFVGHCGNSDMDNHFYPASHLLRKMNMPDWYLLNPDALKSAIGADAFAALDAFRTTVKRDGTPEDVRMTEPEGRFSSGSLPRYALVVDGAPPPMSTGTHDIHSFFGTADASPGHLSSDVSSGGRKSKAKRAKGGFIKKRRLDVRDERGCLVTEKEGNRTCLEDAVANAGLDILNRYNTQLDMAALYGLWDQTQDTPFEVVQAYFIDAGLQLNRCTADFLLGGPAAVNLLRCDTDLFIVQLAITYDNQDRHPDMHCVYYNAHDGYILDNYRYSKPIYLETSDRLFSTPPTTKEKQRAYALWHAASPSFAALKVRIFNVYRIEA